ncbi:MAG: Na+/H+ antiporter NhaA [Mucilaginibacter sp.]|nr:Na+/H+ antiporter NhaA [Mucilaginibacter sp.]
MDKSPIDKLVRPVSNFIHLEYTSGLVLFLGVVTAIVWVNSPWAHHYHSLWETPLSVGLGGINFKHPLHLWVNDGLMAVFFFVIGLELKREFMAGELSTVKKAALPMIAALGGMLIPAVIYSLVNSHGPGSKGWGVPMATDIAFALAILSLAGKQIPASIKVFLSALAVADDLGAVLVIAVFYSGELHFITLLIGLGILLLMVAGNSLGVRHTAFYLLLGIAAWVCFLLSGVQATIAGVLAAFTMPARTRVDEKRYSERLRELSYEFDAEIPNCSTLTTPHQHETIEHIKALSLAAQTPLQKIETGLHPWVAFIVMPLFALANSGIVISQGFFGQLVNPVSLGVIAGLVLGKLVGVFSFTWLAVKTKLADLPSEGNWRHILGVAMLAGIGFTMSLFITALAFKQEELVNQAKYGILLSSLVAGIGGSIILRTAGRKT